MRGRIAKRGARDPWHVGAPVALGAPAALGRATPPGKVAPSRRLQQVLRAGTVVGTPVDASESGLTRALKKTSLVPTGACVARTFDPDYCAYDRYYAIGVALVSSTLGALVNSTELGYLWENVANALNDALGGMCHTPKDTWSGMVYGQDKQFHAMSRAEKETARLDFGPLCHVLERVLTEEKALGESLKMWGVPLRDAPYNLHPMMFMVLALKLLQLITRPAALVQNALIGLDGDTTDVEGDRRAELAIEMISRTASALWILKYISRFMNEHALMVASFFRVNAKRLDNGEPALLDIKDFVRRCKEDIANGPNPPPEPPEYDGEPYSPFSPGKMERQQREAKERRRLAELRARREKRDPLMEGLDYPETYASASDAY